MSFKIINVWNYIISKITSSTTLSRHSPKVLKIIKFPMKLPAVPSYSVIPTGFTPLIRQIGDTRMKVIVTFRIDFVSDERELGASIEKQSQVFEDFYNVFRDDIRLGNTCNFWRFGRVTTQTGLEGAYGLELCNVLSIDMEVELNL